MRRLTVARGHRVVILLPARVWEKVVERQQELDIAISRYVNGLLDMDMAADIIGRFNRDEPGTRDKEGRHTMGVSIRPRLYDPMWQRAAKHHMTIPAYLRRLIVIDLENDLFIPGF